MVGGIMRTDELGSYRYGLGTDRRRYYCRCPKCRQIIPENMIEMGCPACGWIPLLQGRPERETKIEMVKGGSAGRHILAKTTEPLVLTFDEGNRLRIMAELPGAKKGDINLNIDSGNGTLTIFASTPDHRYYKEIDLPCPIKGPPLTTYRDGVLGIEVGKRTQV